MKENSTLANHRTDKVACMEEELRYISTIIKIQGGRIVSDYTIPAPKLNARQWGYEHGEVIGNRQDCLMNYGIGRFRRRRCEKRSCLLKKLHKEMKKNE